MDESEPVQTKTKLQQRQERLGYKAAVRLQAELDKEERQRIVRSLSIRERGSHTLQQLRGYSFDEIKALFETTMRRVNTFVPMESDVDRTILELAGGSLKRPAEKELDQESSKRQKTGESSELAKEPKDKDDDELFTLKALGSTGRSSELEIIL
ncbi:hypothetical protein Tco_1047824, partial [Tanacetum coccineum]